MPAAPPPAPPVVCEVTAPGGVGRAILVTLRGAPCALIPFHVVGDLERLDDEVIVVAPNAAVATLRPDAFLAHSPPPEDGRPPDPNRMDYVLVACGVPEGVDRAHLRPLEDSLSRFDARGDARRVLDAERVPGDDDAHVVAAGDEVFVSTLTREDWSSAARAKRKERRVLVEWRRGFVTSPPGDREGVSLRYDARTVAGESGCAVVAHSKRRACDDPDGAVTVASARGCGRLVAMHRAGAPGRDAEAVALADVMRDVLETTAARGVRRAAERGNFGPAVAELACASPKSISKESHAVDFRVSIDGHRLSLPGEATLHLVRGEKTVRVWPTGTALYEVAGEPTETDWHLARLYFLE